MIGSQGSERGDRFRRTWALLVFCLLLGAAACTGRDDNRVLVIERTRSYHRADCARVRMANALTMTREEALALDCKPCPECRPDANR